MRRRALGQLLLVLSVTVVAACGSQSTGTRPMSSASRGTATVTLDVFSGVPNPTWVLDVDQASEFLSQWDDLFVGVPIEYPAILGYRGMSVEFADGSRIWVTDGVATEESDGPPSARIDPGRALELWLLETGAGTVDSALLESIRTQIGG